MMSKYPVMQQDRKHLNSQNSEPDLSMYHPPPAPNISSSSSSNVTQEGTLIHDMQRKAFFAKVL